MNGPSISVVIPAYNAATYLRGAIDSALRQSRPALEILVVDDGSRDRTAAVASAYPPPVRCLQRGNGGPAAARNAGVQAACGAWLAFLDADDAWEPGHLAAAMALAVQTHADFVFSDARVLSPTRACESWLRRSGHEWLLQRADPILDHPLAELITRGFFALPSSVLVRKAAVLAAGGFDPAVPAGIEDLDLWLRLAPATRWVFNRSSRILRTEAGHNLTASVLRMAAGAECVWRKALHAAPAELDPELRRRLRAHLADAQWEQVYWGFWCGQLQLARRAAWRSLYTRWAWRTLVYGLMASLPPPAPGVLQRLNPSNVSAAVGPSAPTDPSHQEYDLADGRFSARTISD